MGSKKAYYSTPDYCDRKAKKIKAQKELDYESIYLDLINWNVYDLSLESWDKFLSQPTFLIIKSWEHCQKREVERTQNYSFSPARIAYLVESIAKSFNKDSEPPSFSDGLPFKNYLGDNYDLELIVLLEDLHKEQSLPNDIIYAMSLDKHLEVYLQQAKIKGKKFNGTSRRG